ncbi:manganese-dependent inorganic pyrophosphatase [Patescibacteria group bacterium]|nr:manganese-dependent inorganic pyrophosphatase [Patescibacteria group bacterium]
MGKIISLGHINPDTDSALSAILISRFAKKIFGFDVEPRVAGDINNETKYLLSLLKINKPDIMEKITDENVVLVDTTEPGQILPGLTDVNLAAIIDHHNLGGLKSGHPILARIEPVGSTATVIYKILKEKNIKIDKISAALMIACIISDTLNLTSPTTSADDKKALKELNKIAKLDLKKFIKAQFAAKSSLEGIATGDIVSKDYKNFEMGKSKVGIGVWETTNTESISSKKSELMAALEAKKTAEKLDFIFFLVVDILKENGIMYIAGESEKTLAEKVFGAKAENNEIFLKGIVSRKKQVVPPLMGELTKKE